MRTLIAIFLTVMCALSLTGCAERPGSTETDGGNSGTGTAVSPPAEGAAAGAETENLPGEETEMNFINLTVNGTTVLNCWRKQMGNSIVRFLKLLIKSKHTL